MLFSRHQARTSPSWVLAAGLLCLAFSLAAASPETESAFRGLAELAASSPLAGDDLSPLLENDQEPYSQWRRRPPDDAFEEFAHTGSAIRLHVARELLPSLVDKDLDGLPDRIAAALAVSRRTLGLCARAGLGGPLDDGDGETDIYLADLGGTTRGFAVTEQVVPPGRGGFGFAVVDASPRQSELDFEAALARMLGRLVLAAFDGDAPVWWTEPGVLWIQAQITGPPAEMARVLAARWNHPELGLTTADPLLSRGNIGLIWALDDPSSQRRLMRRSWRALADRAEGSSAWEAIDAAAMRSVGRGLIDLQLRAGMTQLASGFRPSRLALSVAELPLVGGAPPLPLTAGGASIIGVQPADEQTAGTEISVLLPGAGWHAALLAHRRGGGWERGALEGRAETGELTVPLPWRDYDRAYLLLGLGENDAPVHRPTVSARRMVEGESFALSSLSVVPVGEDRVQLRWSSAWERRIYGWVVERGSGPNGPWSLAHDIPLPALGVDEGGGGYTIEERLPRDGRPTYYRIVALTREGLRIGGPAVAAPQQDALR